MKVTLSQYLLDNMYENICYPHFTMEIVDSDELCERLDKIRSALGLTPFFYGEKIDNERWYDCFLVVNLETKEVESLYGVCFPEDGFTYEIPHDNFDVMTQVVQQLKDDFHTTLEDIRKTYLEETDYE